VQAGGINDRSQKPMKLRFLGLELIIVFRRARRHRLVFFKDQMEPYVNSSTMEEQFGDVLVRIFAPFDRKTGETVFRFTLLNARQGYDEDGDLLVRRSLYDDMEKDVYSATRYACRYIRRAKQL
jgi:hypothetical protein